MEEKNIGTSEELYQFAHLALCDIACPTKPGLAYLFGETIYNEEPSLDAGSEIAKTGVPIAILDYPPYAGYPGVSFVQKGLLERGVPNEHMFPLPNVLMPGFPDPNTHTEAAAFIRFAKERGARIAVAVAPPLHLVRAALTAISAVRQNYPELRVYFRAAKSLDWTKDRIRHSQGIAEGTRLELLRGELDRLRRYYSQGDLCTLREAIDYIISRDAGE